MANPIIKTLKRIFNISDVKASSTDNQKRLHPGYTDNKTNKVKPINFSDDIQKLYEMWISDNFEDSESLKNRMERYSALSYAYYNNTIFSKAINLYADETVQSDLENQVIGVSAKQKKVETYIKDFLDDVGITDQDVLRDAAFNLVLYGDNFWINSIDYDGKNIDSVTPVSVQDVKQRIEFNASEVAKKQTEHRHFMGYIQKDTKLQALYTMMQQANEKVDYSHYFKSYLFGFHLGEKIYLPPWNVSHFRIFTSLSEFFPYGRPVMINCLAPFRQLQSGKNLMALARANNFPLKDFEVEVDENMDASEKWEAVDDAKENYHNLSHELQAGREQFALGAEIWRPSNLLNMNVIESRMNLDDIADIEMLRDDLIMGTDIPKGYLIVDRASFGTSGQALLRQHKPFARAIYKVQTSILKQIAQLIRLQFVISGDYKYDEPFELTMPFPEVEESSDRLRIKNDTLRLAKDVMDNIGDAIGLQRGEALPPEVVKDIMSQLSFLDSEDIDGWIDKVIDMQQQAAKEDEEEQIFASYNSNNKNRINEKIKRITATVVNECYFKAKKDGKTRLWEASRNGRHFYSSFKMTDYEKILLEVMQQDKSNKLVEDKE